MAMDCGISCFISWTLALVFATVIFNVYRKRRKYVNTINAIPGPKGIPIFGTTFHFLGKRENRLNEAHDIFEKFRPYGICRHWLGPLPQLQLFSAEIIEPILNSQKHVKKGFVYNFLHSWLKLGLLTSYGDKWHTRRRLLTPAFHFRILEDVLPIINEQSIILVKKFGNDIGKPFGNIYKNITLCTLDIICASAMGRDIKAQLEEDSDYVKAVLKSSELISERTLRPWLYPDFIYNLTENGKKAKMLLSILHEFTKRVIGEKKEQFKNQDLSILANGDKDESVYGRKRRLAFLDLLLEYSEGGKLLTDEDIQEEVDTFMFEGHDTTASGVFWTIYLLGLHPEHQEEVHQELDTVFAGDNERFVTHEDLKNLKYLDQVCKESLRLYPPVPLILRHVEEDVSLGSFVVPAGTDCLISIILLHRDPRYFPDPKKFDPNRFLPENCKGRHPYAYAPFSAGPRNCIGQKFAQMEEKVLLAHVLRKYKFTSLNKPSDIPAFTDLVLRPLPELQIKVEKRNL